MLIIPFELLEGSSRGPIVVVMILEKENLDRMKDADPFDLAFRQYRQHMPVNRPISDLDFVIAYEEDTNQILEFKTKGNLAGLLNWLERGRRIQPGDLQPPFPFRRT